jgi:hypothetical protein
MKPAYFDGENRNRAISTVVKLFSGSKVAMLDEGEQIRGKLFWTEQEHQFTAGFRRESGTERA